MISGKITINPKLITYTWLSSSLTTTYNSYEQLPSLQFNGLVNNDTCVGLFMFDGDASKNLDAFESILRCMHDNGVGYGAINLTLDHDPVCGFDGYIDRICPKCGRDVTKPVSQSEINEIAARFGIPFPYHLRVESASLVD